MIFSDCIIMDYGHLIRKHLVPGRKNLFLNAYNISNMGTCVLAKIFLYELFIFLNIKAIVLPVPYGYFNFVLQPMEQNTLKVSENEVISENCRTIQEKVEGDWKKFHSEEFHNPY